jgi:streptococcal pilin isopeptide linkage domain
MITRNRRMFTSLLAILLCMIMCMPNVAIFAADQTNNAGAGAFFNVTNLTIGGKEIIKDGAVTWTGGTFEFETGETYILDATWGAAHTDGWVAGDYLEFNIPFASITSFTNVPASLNDGYGTFQMVGTAGSQKVRFTLSETGCNNISLKEGTFTARGTTRNLDEETKTGQENIGGIDIDWQYNVKTSSGIYWIPNSDFHKDAWRLVGSTNTGSDANYVFRINQVEMAAQYKAAAQSGAPWSHATSSPKENIMIVDELPAGVRFLKTDPNEVGTFQTVLRGPTTNGSGEVVQSDTDRVYFDLTSYLRVPYDGVQEYQDYYDDIENRTGPAFGIYSKDGRNVVIVNAGTLPSPLPFYQMMNSITGSGFTSTDNFLLSYLGSSIGSTPYTSPQERLEAWKATNFFSENLPIWGYIFQFQVTKDWDATEVNDSEKSITNYAEMTYGTEGSIPGNVPYTFSRLHATVKLGDGELMLVKVDANDLDKPLPGVKFDIYQYTGNPDIDEAITDAEDTSKWTKAEGDIVTGDKGTFIFQGSKALVYMIKEITPAAGYSIDSFMLYDQAGNELPKGIFAMPASGGITVVAKNTKTAPISPDLVAHKILTGRPTNLAANEFEFALYKGEDISGLPYKTAKNAVDGTVTFTGIDSFTDVTTSPAVYTIVEIEPTSNKVPGVTYSQVKYTAEVSIEKNSDDELEAVINYKNAAGLPISSNEVVFTNTYAAEGTEIVLEGTKELTGRNLAESNYVFNFEVLEDDVVVSEGVSNADGEIIFDTIEYTAAGTHNYVVKEVKETISGVTYSEESFRVAVAVTDNGSGVLTATPTYTDGAIVFENEYTPEPIYVPIAATKEMTGGRVITANEFTFEIYKNGEKIGEANNAFDGAIAFDPVEFDIGDEGANTITLKEVPDTSVEQITYDTTEIEITVNITYSATTGLLTPTVTYPEGGAKFTNVYTPEPIDVELEANKVLSGRYLTAKEFLFEVYDANGVIVSRGTNEANGKITFSAIEFDEDDKNQTYTYTVKEVPGIAYAITYDRTVFTVTIKVTQNADGTLASTITYPTNGITFRNSYNPPPPPPPVTETTAPEVTTSTPEVTTAPPKETETSTPTETETTKAETETTSPPEETTGPEETTAPPQETTGPEETTKTIEVPELTRSQLPDPNDPNSPEFFTLMENGIPLATYKKVQQPDGSYIYVEFDGTPLGTVTPATGDSVVKIVIAILLSASMIGMIAFLTYMKKARGKKARR